MDSFTADYKPVRAICESDNEHQSSPKRRRIV
jgi:hypothetical protein